MKDHEIAQLVNALRDCAVEFHDAQQLRERIATLVVPALRGVQTPESYLADTAVRYLTEIGRANKGIRRLRRKLDKALEDIDDLSGACSIAWAAAAKAEPLRAPTPQDCVDIAEWHKSECEACCINPEESEDYGRVMVDAVRLVLVDGPKAALQQSSSGITAGAENPSQVVVFGAAAQNRTADLLITNQDKNTPETSNNQDVTPKTAPAQSAQVAPTESNGCEGVTAGLERYIDDHIDWLGRLSQAADYESAREPFSDAARELLTRFYVELRSASADVSPNANWLTQAHTLCADAGVPSGHIANRLEGLRLHIDRLRNLARLRFGYAPGDYQNECSVCMRLFGGDKRAVVCSTCADKRIGAP